MNPDRLRRARADIVRLADDGLDWVTFSTQASEVLSRVVPFQRSCWHTVDPGTVLLTGSLNQNVGCSGSWLAEHEYVLDDVNKWSYLARSGRQAGATSLATHGDLSRSARHRSQEAYGVGDELRGSFVADGTYWGAAGFLRDAGEATFTDADVRFLASICASIAVGFRRALLATALPFDQARDEGPGVVVFDEQGEPESISPAAQRWIAQMIEVPPPATPADSKMVRVVAALARASNAGDDPIEVSALARPDAVGLVAVAVRHPTVGRRGWPHGGHHPVGGAQRGCAPSSSRVRTVGTRVSGDAAVLARPVDQADGPDARGICVHRAGPPQVHLR